MIIVNSLVGVVMTGLSHLTEVRTSSEFAIGVIRGLGSNLSESSKDTFAKEVFESTFSIVEYYIGYIECYSPYLLLIFILYILF